MELRKRTKNDKWISSHLVNTFQATQEQIEKAFGEPTYTEGNIDEKVQNEWELMSGKHIVTIYDWKEYRHYDYDEVLEWHIGSDCDDADFVSNVKKEILTKIASAQ
jgi:hypothetical protein